MSMAASAGAPPSTAKAVPTWKLPTLMTLAGAIAGALIVTSYELTLPRIEQHKGEAVRAAVQEVLKAPQRFDTLYAYENALVKHLPAGVSAKGIDRLYLGYDGSGNRIGFAISATENGFQDPVTVMFGYDNTVHRLIAMKVIANKETPGLGNKIESDSAFVNGFVNAALPLTGVKSAAAKTTPGDVLMITGATISSRAVIRIINNAITRWQPLMDAYREEATP